MTDAIHARKYTGNRPKGTGQVIGCEGVLEEHNRRVNAAIRNDIFVEALRKARQEELRIALLIECEIHKVPNSEELTAYERAMERVKAGASISEVIPFKLRGDPPMTLAGVGSSWMA